VLALAVGAFGTWYFVFRDDAPAEVSLDQASRTLEREAGTSPSSTATTTPTSTAAGTGGAGGSSLDGTWNVDTTVGSFSDFSGTFVGYRVQEELAGIGGKTAVGRTPKVTGSLTLQGTNVTAVKVEADSRFPRASFELTQPIALGSVPAEGQTIQAQATGKLTLHGVTKDVTIPLQAQIRNGLAVVTGRLPVKFSDYSISQPRSVIVLSVADQGELELQIFFRRSQ
jgi:polyisoprenoid-binding protein YceI